MTFGNMLQPGREAKWPGLFCATLLGVPGGNPGISPWGLSGMGALRPVCRITSAGLSAGRSEPPGNGMDTGHFTLTEKGW